MRPSLYSSPALARFVSPEPAATAPSGLQERWPSG